MTKEQTTRKGHRSGTVAERMARRSAQPARSRETKSVRIARRITLPAEED
jgi:hypothetical protein